MESFSFLSPFRDFGLFFRDESGSSCACYERKKAGAAFCINYEVFLGRAGGAPF